MTNFGLLLLSVFVFVTTPEAQMPIQREPVTHQKNSSAATRVNAGFHPEINIADYLLHSRKKIDAMLGTPTNVGGCADTTGTQFEYKDGSYACVRSGRVVLFSYNIRARVRSAEEALRAVGIQDSKRPYDLPGSVGWFFDRGNPLTVGNGMAELVIVFLGGTPNITVKMDGSHPLRTTEPKPDDAAAHEYLKLYQSDFPGVFQNARLQGGSLTLYVSGQWSSLNPNMRRQILESLSERWQAVNRGYGNSVQVSEIFVRRNGTGAVIGKWPR